MSCKSDIDQSKKWVGTWCAAPQLVEPYNNPPSPGLTNNTLRQVVRVSIGGEMLRVKFSNEFSTSPVTMKSVKIAVSTDGCTIDVKTSKQLKFKGNGYYNQYSEACREKVNKWILANGHFDAVLDFDKYLRNYLDTLSLSVSYQNDGLHPSAKEYKRLVDSIDLRLFEGLEAPH